MKVDFSYMEITAILDGFDFKKADLETLEQNMYRSAIHTFGWPIAAVIFGSDYKPSPIKDGIEAINKSMGHRDYWTVKRSSEFYYLGELFENNRRPECVFIDTRTNRIAESILRVTRFYETMATPPETKVKMKIKHGNIKDKILAAGNSARIFPHERRCRVNEVSTEIEFTLNEIKDPLKLKEYVYLTLRDLAEMFEMFKPSKEEFSDKIVDAFLNGKII